MAIKKSKEDKNKLVPDEVAAKVVREIYRMKLSGMNATGIAAELSANRILTPSEYKKNEKCSRLKWSDKVIIWILQNEIYTGTLISKQQFRLENTHEAIISRHDFNLVQQIMKANTRTTPGCNKVHLFSALLRCGACGGNMTHRTSSYKGNQYRYYQCMTGKGNGCTASGAIKEDDLTACVSEILKSHVNNLVTVDSMLANPRNQFALQKVTVEYDEKIAERKQKLEKTLPYNNRLYDDLIEGLLEKDEYEYFKVEYATDIIRLKQEIKDLELERDNILSGKNEQQNLLECLRQLNDATTPDRNVLLHLIHSIRMINKTELEIIFDYQI